MASGRHFSKVEWSCCARGALGSIVGLRGTEFGCRKCFLLRGFRSSLFAIIGWSGRLNNVRVRSRVVDAGCEDILSERIKPGRPCRLGYVCLLYRVLFFVLLIEWKKPHGGQQMARQSE